ncbi:MAG: hypothetical protein ACNA7W_12560 [Pseudomonadales bacterium]
MLTWDANQAQDCEASGGWSGRKSASGSETVGPVDGETVFRLSCSGDGGGVSQQVALVVDAGSAPSVSLRADPEQVPPNGTTTLTWAAPEGVECSATGEWSGAKDSSGSYTTGPLTQSASFGLSCSGENGNALAAVSVEVLDKTLRWEAPTHNEDGSPVAGLGGFVIYWGEQSGSYTASVRIEDPAATEWVADIRNGSYFFALTAFDRQGNESSHSNEVRKSIL